VRVMLEQPGLRTIVGTLAALAVVMLPILTGAASCAPSKGDRSESPGALAVFRGVLHTGMRGIGGEHTGVELACDDGRRVEVEYGTLNARIDSFDGQTVEISGTPTTLRYVERGDVHAIAASGIRAVDPSKQSTKSTDKPGSDR